MNFPYKKQIDFFINTVFILMALLFMVAFYYHANPPQEKGLQFTLEEVKTTQQ